MGFDDYCNLAKPCFPPTFCPNGEPTLMDTKEDCLIGGQLPADPQPLDIDNYHKAYHADAVASFSGYSAVPHTVNFTWDGSDIHNERKYLINWRNNCTGVWQLLATSLLPNKALDRLLMSSILVI